VLEFLYRKQAHPAAAAAQLARSRSWMELPQEGCYRLAPFLLGLFRNRAQVEQPFAHDPAGGDLDVELVRVDFPKREAASAALAVPAANDSGEPGCGQR